jgi:putative membrane-bound dehydrogenase-like protein
MSTQPPRAFRIETFRFWLSAGLVWIAGDARVFAQVPADAPVPAAEAPGRMSVPEGFRVTLFAAEPDVVQPIAFTIDPRGRLWVAEGRSYPDWLGGPPGTDRILIFEDADGDGRFDTRKVFWSGGTRVSGIALGFGGVWLCAAPDLLFIPDADGDDVPDGPPVAKLDGWSTKAQHNLFNALTWAPDGWLWGCNGILDTSRVGRPGTPDAERIPLNCGVWRYHPTRDVFEVVAHGTTNPWGLDFDDVGEAFITNCVIPHVYHVVPGAHFERMFGQDFNPYLYELMPTCADHIHWAGGAWQDSRGGAGRHGEAGGGHAHVGAMIYLGDNWPERYRGDLFTCNLHGRRVNRDRFERSGSGAVARHEPDFLRANDAWFRGLELKYGPDGGVYLTDWSDTGECHETDADGAHRENGRVYKITYGDVKPVRVDLAGLDDVELARLALHRNDWYVRTARRLLQERAAAGHDLSEAHRVLAEIERTHRDVPRRLRALWALYGSGGLSAGLLRERLGDPSEGVRAWAVRLLCDAGPPDAAALERMAILARDDPSPRVRLALASALQRLPAEARRPIAEGLVSHPDAAADRSLELMIWYGVEPLGASDPGAATALAAASRLPRVRQYLARRTVAADPVAGLTRLVGRLADCDDAARRDLLAGMLDALQGRNMAATPTDWARAAAALHQSSDPIVRLRAAMLGLILGDDEQARALRTRLDDAGLPINERRDILRFLIERRAPGLAADLLARLDDPAWRGPALRGLAAFDDPGIPGALLDRYTQWPTEIRADAVATLASRPAWAGVLLEAVERGVVPRADISVPVARQIQAFKAPELTDRLERAWGSVRPTAQAKAELIPKYRTMLADGPAGDPARGRRVFNRTCAQCHRLFDAGGDVGPDLTGADRTNPGYLLEHILDPGATVGRDFRLTTVATTDGRLIAGIVREQTDAAVILQTANERVVVPHAEVDDLTTANASMMPEGLLEPLTPQELRDLFTYLAAPAQVAAP